MDRFRLPPLARPCRRIARETIAAAATLMLCLQWAAAAHAADRSLDELQRDVARLGAEFRDGIRSLAAWCDENQLAVEADQTRRWNLARDPEKLYLVIDPAEWSLPAATDDVAPAVAEWRRRYETLRDESAAARFELARRAIKLGRASLAYEQVLETVRLDPDHESARRLLGYQRFREAWRTSFEVQMLRQGRTWHATFGWLARGAAGRYERGERQYNGRWMSADKERDLRSDLERGWEIETDHYKILTNHSHEAGVQLGVRLERLYRAWQQTFAGYYASPEQLAQMFEGRPASRAAVRKFAVTYFRTRAQYNEFLGPRISADINITSGMYLADDQRAYFFALEERAEGKADDFTTLYHEATHQLFSESRPGVPIPGEKSNFWIIEGIACYMESLTQEQGYYTLGGREAIRFRDAEFRLLESRFYVPLADLALLGMLPLQHDPRIAKLYSQSSGLTQFLMHADRGRRRDALIEYLFRIYTGQDNPGTLAELLGQAYGDIDQDYQRYVVTPQPAEK